MDISKIENTNLFESSINDQEIVACYICGCLEIKEPIGHPNVINHFLNCVGCEYCDPNNDVHHCAQCRIEHI